MNKRIKKKHLPLTFRNYKYAMKCSLKVVRHVSSGRNVTGLRSKGTWLCADDAQHEIMACLVDGYLLTENLYFELVKFIKTIPWIRDLINTIKFGSIDEKVPHTMAVEIKSIRQYMRSNFPKWTLLDSHNNPSNPEVSIWDENDDQFKTITPKVIYYVDFDGTTPIFRDKDGNVVNLTI